MKTDFKKTSLTLLLTIALVLSMFPGFGGVTARAATGDLSIAGDGNYTYDSNTLNITGDGSYDISPSPGGAGDLTSGIVIESDVMANITFSGLNINTNISSGAALTIEPGADVYLTIIGNNTLKSSDGSAALEISPGARVTIMGSGSLTAYGGTDFANGYGGAGIGGSGNNEVGEIIISSGNIIAIGGYQSAGIGGGYDESCVSPSTSGDGPNGGKITINGGTVTAYCGDSNGAGIGGGFHGNGGIITINDGIVTAAGAGGSAGIGGGRWGGAAEITINGGTVNATGGDDGAAAIGSGESGAGSSIIINGGTITAKGIGGAGLGGGDLSNPFNGTVIFNGGTLTASSAGSEDYATAIGANLSITIPNYTYWYNDTDTSDPGGTGTTAESLQFTNTSAHKFVKIWDEFQPTAPAPSPFLMNRDNYSFNNSRASFGYPNNYRIPVERYQLLFSLSDSLYLYNGLGPWGGSCYGFSSTALSFFAGNLPVSNYGGGYLYGLPRPNDNAVNNKKLRELIELYQISQFTMYLYECLVGNLEDAASLVQSVENFKNGGPGVIVCVYGELGGHAVVAYDAIDKGNGSYDIYIYDNNYPQETDRKLSLNINTGLWSYTLWPGLTFGPDLFNDYFSFVLASDVHYIAGRRVAMGGGANMDTGSMNISVPKNAQVHNSSGKSISDMIKSNTAHEIIPLGLVQGAPSLSNSLYSAPNDSYSVGAGTASFSGGGTYFNVSATDPNAVITAQTGVNGSVSVGGSGGFSIMYGTNTTANSPMTLTGTVNGNLKASANGDSLVVSGTGTATFTATDGAGSKSYSISPGQSVVINYKGPVNTEDPSGSNDNDNGNDNDGGQPVGGSGTVPQPSNSFEGGNNSYEKGSGKALVHTTNKDFSLFHSAKVDGKSLTRDSQYKAESGSTKITLNAEYLDSLSVGRHTLDVLFSDGVTIKSGFSVTGEALLVDKTSINAYVNPFNDINKDHWFYADVEYVFSRGLMLGISEDLFDPYLNLTRGMAVTTLYRHAGSPDMSGVANTFDDVPEGQWYTDALKWAVSKGICVGYGDGRFGPGDNITRQDLAVIITRYIDSAGIKPATVRSYLKFADDAEIADYAYAAVQRCVETGIIVGRPENLFDPRNATTRAEFAAILHRALKTSAN